MSQNMFIGRKHGQKRRCAQVLNLAKGTATILACLGAFLSAISQSSSFRGSSSTSSPSAQILTSSCVTRAGMNPTLVEPTAMIQNASDTTWNVRIFLHRALVSEPLICLTASTTFDVHTYPAWPHLHAFWITNPQAKRSTVSSSANKLQSLNLLPAAVEASAYLDTTSWRIGHEPEAF